MGSRRGKVAAVTDFIFLGSKITADGDCNHEINRCLLRARKAITNLDITLKSRDITLWTKLHIVKAMVFPAVIYKYKSWTIKKVEWQKIDAFKSINFCGAEELRVPWAARRSNQLILRKSTLNIFYKDWCWGWSSNSLATSCEELTHWKTTLMVGKTESKRRKGCRGWDG